ncbi:hypothetical protein MHO82_20400 [Vibrio sp. Of7-15]|uniref:hypothetical protein n=1 Tax=Vibrio sp. Of7-15 TaxID=2724879 RepID=UPI001EF2D82F|nr:hypothetical protein [Vibrio sp. Of7-15]MCG7499231.1 hypothetical protein [Vibrio sp. Of7-15]
MEQFCKKCQCVTPHKEQVQERKRPQYKKTFWDGVKESIIERILIPGITDFAVKALCDLDRFVICKVCGHRRLDNKGTEFE